VGEGPGGGAGGAGGVVGAGWRRRVVERLRVAFEQVEFPADGARKARRDGRGRRGRRGESVAEAPWCGEGWGGGKVGCVREPSPVVMGSGEEDGSNNEVLEEANGHPRVVRLAQIRA